jgi:hypothetical protein
MTAETVIRAIRADGTPEEQALAIAIWEFIVAKVKPGMERMPIAALLDDR